MNTKKTYTSTKLSTTQHQNLLPTLDEASHSPQVGEHINHSFIHFAIMSEDEDSRTATLGKKRTLETIYDLVTDSDSSDEEPAHKRPRQISQTSNKKNLPPATFGGQSEYISLLDSDDDGDDDNEDDDDDEEDEYASAESGEVFDDNVVSLGSSSSENPTRTNISQDKETSDDEYVSSGADSIEDGIPIVPETAHAAIERENPAHLPLDSELPHIADTSRAGRKNTSQSTTHHEDVHRIAIAENRRLHIGKLPEDISSDDMLAFFKDFKVESVFLPLNSHSKKSVGFGFVCLSSASDAARAVVTLNGKNVGGHPVRVKLSLRLGSTFDSGNAVHFTMATSGNQDDEQPGRNEDHTDQLSTRSCSDDSPQSTQTSSGPKPSVKNALNKKQFARFQKVFGGDYLEAFHEAVVQQSECAILIPEERLVYDFNGVIAHLPQMVINGSPISISELDFATFIPLFFDVNSDRAIIFLQKVMLVVDAFQICVNAFFQHININRRKAILKIVRKRDESPYKASIYDQVAAGIATTMPHILEKALLEVDLGKNDTIIREAIKKALSTHKGANQLESIDLAAGSKKVIQASNATASTSNSAIGTNLPTKSNQYSENTIRVFTENTEMCQTLELKIRSFAANSKENHLRFPPMGYVQRAFIQFLAVDFGLDAESIDNEPSQYVLLSKTPKLIFIPEMLAEIVNMKPAVRANVNMVKKNLIRPKASHDPEILQIRHAPDLEDGNLSKPSLLVHAHPLSTVTQAEIERDNELQMMYFPPSRLSNPLPNCLDCGQAGHYTAQCGPIVCRSCGDIDVHFTWACPKIVRCPKCRAQGHGISDCPEKLARSKGERTKCDHCGSLDHTETACNSLWRSYKPHEVKKVTGLHTNCFSCGSDQHYGIDCGLHPPNRLWFSQSFSMNDAQQYSNNQFSYAGKDYSIKGSSKKKTKDFSIKGRAKNEPIDLDADSDVEDFLHPPVPKAKSGSGIIQINNRNTRFERYQDTPPPPPAPPTSHNYARDQMPAAHQRFPQRPPRPPERAVAAPPPPAYHDYRDEGHRYGRPGGGGYGDDHYGGTDHYQPQQHHYDDAADYYNGNSTAVPNTRGGGGPRGGFTLRGGGAPRGSSAPRGGGAPRGGKSSRGRGNVSGNNGPPRVRGKKKKKRGPGTLEYA